MLSATNLRTYHFRQLFRKFRRRCLPRQRSPLGCRHRILYRIAGQLWCIMVSRKIPEQKVARLTDLRRGILNGLINRHIKIALTCRGVAIDSYW